MRRLRIAAMSRLHVLALKWAIIGAMTAVTGSHVTVSLNRNTHVDGRTAMDVVTGSDLNSEAGVGPELTEVTGSKVTHPIGRSSNTVVDEALTRSVRSDVTASGQRNTAVGVQVATPTGRDHRVTRGHRLDDLYTDADVELTAESDPTTSGTSSSTSVDLEQLIADGSDVTMSGHTGAEVTMTSTATPYRKFDVQLAWRVIQILISFVGFSLNGLALAAFLLHGKSFTKTLRNLLAHQVCTRARSS